MTYCYRTEDDTVVELVMGVNEMMRRQRRDGSIVLDDGREAIRDFVAEQEEGARSGGTWPMWSDAAGHNPSQDGEVRRAIAARGLKADVHNGQVKFESQKHRKEICEKVFGLYDRNGGYGDPQRQGRKYG